MRVFVDSNVLIAAALTDGECRRLLDRILSQHECFLSEECLAETGRKLLGKFKIPRTLAEAFQEKLRQGVTVLPAQKNPPKISRDPKDDWVLAAALQGGCRCVLSGDADLTVLKSYRGVALLRPRDFLAFEAETFARRKRSKSPK